MVIKEFAEKLGTIESDIRENVLFDTNACVVRLAKKRGFGVVVTFKPEKPLTKASHERVHRFNKKFAGGHVEIIDSTICAMFEVYDSYTTGGWTESRFLLIYTIYSILETF